MPSLQDIVEFCDERTRRKSIIDFPGAENGLQISNDGKVTRIGAAVDAGLNPFKEAVTRGIDFLIVHHGIYWNPPQPLTGSNYLKIKTAIEGNLAVYSSHLPLDAHPEIGNNQLIAEALQLQPESFFLEHQGTPIALITSASEPLDKIQERMMRLFPGTCRFIRHGSPTPTKIAILSGSGRSVLPYLESEEIDTLITGELRQEHYNYAQERGLNLLIGGHYATETFGVRALASEVATTFGLNWEFLSFPCPL